MKLEKSCVFLQMLQNSKTNTKVVCLPENDSNMLKKDIKVSSGFRQITICLVPPDIHLTCVLVVCGMSVALWCVWYMVMVTNSRSRADHRSKSAAPPHQVRSWGSGCCRTKGEKKRKKGEEKVRPALGKVDKITSSLAGVHSMSLAKCALEDPKTRMKK